MATMSIRLDDADKKAADILFKKLGITTNSAINMFIKQCLREDGLPFLVTNKSPEPTDRLRIALKELDDYEKGKINLKSYDNIDDLIKDLEEDD